MEVILGIDSKPGVFYPAGDGFFLPTKLLPHNTTLSVTQRLPISCMFDIYLAQVNGERAGFFFTTRFTVENGGGYLMTTLKNKVEATVAEVLIRDEELVVYNYPNKGTLAISPRVNADIDTIFTEQ